jgi:hypothetical protein
VQWVRLGPKKYECIYFKKTTILYHGGIRTHDH